MSENRPKVNAKLDMSGPFMYTEDWQISSSGQNSPSIFQRGNYTLAGNVAFVSLPRPYLSAVGYPNNISFIVTSRTTNQAFVESIPQISAFGVTNLSTISGFTVSGSGTDSGFWMALGYK